MITHHKNDTCSKHQKRENEVHFFPIMVVKVETLDDYWTFDYSNFEFPARGDSLDGLRAYYGLFTHPAVAFAVRALLLPRHWV